MTLSQTVAHTAGPPPPLPHRIRLKLRRIYLDLTGPRIDREWRRAWPLIDSVEGWLLEGQERWLFEAAYSLPASANIVEIGSFKGRSTCALASGCRGTQKRVFAIDPFDGGPNWRRDEKAFFDEFTDNVKRCGVSEYVEPVVALSTEAGRSWTRPISLLFIDGSHEYEAVKTDFEIFFPHVSPGGIVAFHDACEQWPGVLRFWVETARRQLAETGNCLSLAYGRKPASKAI